MKPPHYMAHSGLEVEHFPVNQRLVPKGKEWVMGPVVECPAEGCQWTLGLARELLQVLGDAASEHLEDERLKHQVECQDHWALYKMVLERLATHGRDMAWPPPTIDAPHCGCGKDPEKSLCFPMCVCGCGTV